MMFSNLHSLHILLTLDQALPQTSQEMSANLKTQLQSILVTLLGRSHVSGIRRFSLSNEVKMTEVKGFCKAVDATSGKIVSIFLMTKVCDKRSDKTASL